MNFYPHHISDFNNATRHLTRVERSVYRDAIDRYYDTEQPLTSDLNSLSKRLLCFTEDEKNALKEILSEFFELTDDGYVNDRCEREIEKYRANTNAKAKAGKASAEARRKKKAGRKRKGTGVEQVLNRASTKRQQNPTNQEPITNNHKPITKREGRSFQKPTLQDVADYCLERKNGVDPQTFIDFYESKGWVVGKSKMKDWKACVRTWERRDDKSRSDTSTGKLSSIERSERAIDEAFSGSGDFIEGDFERVGPNEAAIGGDS